MTFAQLVAITGGEVGQFTVTETDDHPSDGEQGGATVRMEAHEPDGRRQSA